MAAIQHLKEEGSLLTFTISGVDVSYANALRRIILSNIPTCVFDTTNPNSCNITINSTNLHNEIIKQRLGCIPIHLNHILDHDLDSLVVELDVENKTDTILVVTTEDFKIKNLATGAYIDDGKLRQIFPPFIPQTGKGEYFIDIVRLKPRLTEEIPGNKIKLSCGLKMATAAEDSMYNVVGTCSYGCTTDDAKMKEQLEIRKQKWADEDKTTEEINFNAHNWVLLEGKRYIITKSFDFVLESVGVYENTDIMMKACDILSHKFITFSEQLERDEITMDKSENTLENCYDVILENEDYTMGNIFNYEIYTTFYIDLNVVNYVGFKKMHPHDTNSILRISITDATKSKTYLKSILKATCEEVVKKTSAIKGLFNGRR